MKTITFTTEIRTRATALARLAACEQAMQTATDGESMWFALKGKREALAALKSL